MLWLVLVCVLAHLGDCAVPPNGFPETQALVSTRADAPTPCGGVVCSIHGTCQMDSATNSTYCKCDHGYRGPTCSLTYFFQKTLEGQLTATSTDSSSKGVRYVLAGESDEIQGKEVNEVSLNVCMQLCDQELSFECVALVYFFVGSPSNGRCAYVNQRIVVSTTDSCISYSRGPEECYFGDGLSFRGDVNTTASGHPCQMWSNQSPNVHSRTPDNYPTAGLDGNYCRNPDGEEKPWCYTTSGDRWEYCNIPMCVIDTHTPTPTPTPQCPAGCLLHGTCEVDTLTGMYTGRCKCFPGYVPGPSLNCSVQESCPNNCSGHGACNVGNCKCQPGWEGGAGDCSGESKLCPDSCSGHGRCDGTTGVCVCFFGWISDNCNIESYPCKNNCSGRGSCRASDGMCDCLNDYAGDDCSEFMCPDACSNHGTCDTTTRMCVCHAGYQGIKCDAPEQPKCPSDCNGHGNCVAGRCFCNHGWSLADCSKYLAPSCLHDCSGHGACEDGVCECDKHYSGQDCSVYTAPHYTPWPITAVIIPLFLVGAFFFWLFYVCYRVDVSDGTSDFLNTPFLRMLFGKREKTFKVVQGEIPGSRLKKAAFEF